jgi:predicted dehydrogenase
MADQQPISVAIAGLGRSGWNIHARLLESVADRFRVVAVQDHLEERRREAVERFDCKSYSDYADLVADDRAELVIVAVPSSLHAEYAQAALAAGRHVVCEKPMATSLAEAEGLLAGAESAPGRFTVFQNWRFKPAFQKVIALARAGTFGRLLQVRLASHGFSGRWDWQTLQSHGGGALNNTGPHLIDAGLMLFGNGQPQVLCVRDRAQTSGDAEDHLKIVLTAPGGAAPAPTIDIEITSSAAYPQDLFHVMGTDGGLTGTLTQLQWRSVRPGSRPETSVSTAPTADRSYNREQVDWVEESWSEEEAHAAGAPEASGEAQFYHELFACIRGDGNLPVTPSQVLRQMRIMEECRRQAPLPITT